MGPILFPVIAPAEVVGPMANRKNSMQKITPADRDFLMKLSQNVKNEKDSENITSIIERLNNDPSLEQADYDFLMNLSRHIKNSAVVTALVQIAQKHHP
jgi:DNA-binding FadR family transcriptional regulator